MHSYQAQNSLTCVYCPLGFGILGTFYIDGIAQGLRDCSGGRPVYAFGVELTLPVHKRASQDPYAGVTTGRRAAGRLRAIPGARRASFIPV